MCEDKRRRLSRAENFGFFFPLVGSDNFKLFLFIITVYYLFVYFRNVRVRARRVNAVSGGAGVKSSDVHFRIVSTIDNIRLCLSVVYRIHSF